MSIELKPCPFCGGEAEMMGDQYPYVECQECAAGFTANHSYEFDEEIWRRLFRGLQGPFPEMIRRIRKSKGKLSRSVRGTSPLIFVFFE